MTHQEFVHAYREGRIEVQVDRAAAAKFISARSILPLVLLPVLGLGVAVALAGHFFIGAAIFLAGLALRFAVRASSQGFVLARALQDAAFYEEVLGRRILVVKNS